MLINSIKQKENKMRMIKKISILMIVIAITLAMAQSEEVVVTTLAMAQSEEAVDYIWTGASDHITWEDNGNWDVGGSYPDDNSDKVTINATTHAITTAGNITVGELDITAGFSGSVTLGGTFTVDDAGTQNGDFTLAGGTFDAAGYAISIDGNWTNSGTYIHGSNNVTFEGSGASNISGSTTFYNFTCTVPDKRIYFEAGKTYTFKGDNTYIGVDAPDLPVRLYSSQAGSHWYINITSKNYLMERVVVKDSYNIGEEKLRAYPAWNKGNNVNWAIIREYGYNYVTYDNGDGTRTMVATTMHEYYLDRTSNDFRPINTTLTFNESTGRWEQAEASYISGFPAYSDGWIEFHDLYGEKNQVVLMRPVAYQVEGQLITDGKMAYRAIRYENAFNGEYDLILYAGNEDMEKLVVINERPEGLNQDLTFDFEIQMPDTLIKEFDGKEEIELSYADLDNRIFYKRGILLGDGETVEDNTILKDFRVWDSAGHSEHIEVKFYKQGDQWFFQKILPQEFLQTAVYPVYSDSVITFDAGSDTQWLNYYKDGGASEQADWDTAHDAGTGSGADNAEVRVKNESGAAPFADIIRQYLPFATGSLQDDAVIQSASLKLTCDGKTNNVNDGLDYVVVVDASNVDSPYGTDDYGDIGNPAPAAGTPTEGSDELDITGINDDGTADNTTFTLNATGLTWIDKTGTTHLGLIQGHDREDSPPGGRESFAAAAHDDADTTKRPHLTITYQYPVISGTVYSDEGITDIGDNRTVAISIEGAAAAATDETTNGAYLITNETIAAGDVLTLYIEDEAGEQGVTVTVASGNDISNLDIYKNYLIVRHDNSGSVTNTNLAKADNNADADITDIYTMASNVLNVASGKELYIPSGHTYVPGDNVNVTGADIHVAGTLTIDTAHTLAIVTSGTLDIDGTVNLDHNSSAIDLAANLDLDGTLDATGVSPSIDVDGAFTFSAGTFTSTSGTFSVGGNWTHTSGTFNHNNGTVDFTASAGTQTFAFGPDAFYDLSHSGAGTLQFSPSWSNMKKITIDADMTSSAGGEGSQSNIPVLIYEATDAQLAAAAQTNGEDIVFIDSNGVRLSHEIEEYNNSTGELWAWVKIPTLSASSDTILYMHYGNASVPASQEDEANVWDSNFKGVWHLIEDAGGTTATDLYIDSTSNDNHGDDEVSDTGKAGQIHDGQTFDGLDDYIDMPDPGSDWEFADGGLNAATSDMTVTAWVNLVAVPSDTYQTITVKGGRTNVIKGYWFFYYPTAEDLNFYICDGTTRKFGNSNDNLGLEGDGWHHVAAVADRSGNVEFFLDGVTKGTTSISSIDGNTVTNNSEDFDIGATKYTNQYWEGSIDEVRVSSTLRSDDWIVTSFNNQDDPTNGAVNYQTFDSEADGTLTMANSLTNSAGTLDLNGYDPAFTSATAPSNTGTIQLQGDETFTNVSNLDTNSGTVTYVGDGNSDVDTYTIIHFTGDDYYNLTFNATDGTDDTFNLGEALTVANDFTITDGKVDTVSGSNYGVTVSNDWTIDGGNFTANNSAISVGRHLVIANTTGLFTTGSATVTLTGTGNISNPHVANVIRFLIQDDGITTTLTGNVYIQANLNTGDDTSFIKADGSNRTLVVVGGLTNDGVTWGAGVGTLTVFFGNNTTTVAGGDYGDCDIFVMRRTASPTMTDHITTTGDVTIQGNGGNVTAYLDTNSYNLTSNDLKLGVNGLPNSAGTLTISGSSIVTVNGDLTVYADDGTQTNALIVDTSGTNAINVAGSWSVDSTAEFDAQNSTVTFNATSGSPTITSGGNAFNNVVFNDAGGTATFQATTALDVNGTFVLTDGILDLDTNDPAVNIAGNITFNGGTITTGSGNITFDGDLTYTDNVGTLNLGNIFIGSSPATTNLASNLICAALTVNLGDILNTNGYNIDCGGNITVIGTLNATNGAGGNTTINLTGHWNVSGTFTNTNSTIILDGTADQNITSGNQSFNNLTLNNTGIAGSDDITLQDSLDIDNNLTITDGDLNGNNQTITIGGNWDNSGAGSYAAGTESVTFDTAGTTSTVAGGTTFYGFVCITPSKRIDFTAATTQTITNTFTLNGQAAGTEIDLNSTIPGTQWNINTTGATSNADYVDVQDSNSTVMIGATNSIDSGNNVNWFTPAEVAAAAAGGGGGGFMPPPKPPKPTLENPEGELKVVINPKATRSGKLISNKYTQDRKVILRLFAGEDTKRMSISNSPEKEGKRFPFQSSYVYDLCQGETTCPEGEYTIYVRFYTKYGRASEILTAAITLREKKPIIEKIKEIPEKIVEKIKEIIKPKEEEKPELPPIPIEEVVTRETPLSMLGKWQLLPSKPIKEFVLAPLPREIKVLTEKFPRLKETLEKVGISKITDVEKLKRAELTLPGLTERAGLPTVRIEPGELALPRGVPIAELPTEIKQELPTEIVFAKTGGELIDFNITLTVSEKGKPQQRINTIAGKPLQLAVKPDKPVESIKGYVVFRKKKPQPGSFQIPRSSFTASLMFANPVFAQSQEKPVREEERLVLLEFEYTDPDGDGIYTAEIPAPLVEGEYEIITVVDYEDPDLGKKEIRLITVVDPEGYIYEKIKNQELRITGAIISLYWLNSETKQYELWPAKEYQQENPQITDATGKYSFLVPEGSYYLKAEAPGYLTYDGKPFQVTEGSGVHINIELKTKYWWLKVFDWKIILLVLVVLLLFYNFYRDRIREKLLRK